MTQIAKHESWHWGVVIYNQIVTWTVFAILAMFLSWHGKYPRDIYFRRAELFWYWIKLERDRRYSSSNKGLRGTPVIRHNHHNPLLRKKNLDKCKFSKWNTKNCFTHSFVTSRAKLIVVHPNMHPNMHTWHIWPYLAYLGAYLGASNMVKWGIPEKILPNAVLMRRPCVNWAPQSPFKSFDQISSLADIPVVITIQN